MLGLAIKLTTCALLFAGHNKYVEAACASHKTELSLHLCDQRGTSDEISNSHGDAEQMFQDICYCPRQERAY